MFEVDLSELFEAEREAEREIGRRGFALLNRTGEDHSSVDWVHVENTQGTLYIYKQDTLVPGVDGQELVFALDIATGRTVGRGAPMVMVESIEVLRKHMILDDLADV